MVSEIGIPPTLIPVVPSSTDFSKDKSTVMYFEFYIAPFKPKDKGWGLLLDELQREVHECPGRFLIINDVLQSRHVLCSTVMRFLPDTVAQFYAHFKVSCRCMFRQDCCLIASVQEDELTSEKVQLSYYSVRGSQWDVFDPGIICTLVISIKFFKGLNKRVILVFGQQEECLVADRRCLLDIPAIFLCLAIFGSANSQKMAECLNNLGG